MTQTGGVRRATHRLEVIATEHPLWALNRLRSKASTADRVNRGPTAYTSSALSPGHTAGRVAAIDDLRDRVRWALRGLHTAAYGGLIKLTGAVLHITEEVLICVRAVRGTLKAREAVTCTEPRPCLLIAVAA